MCAFAAAPLLTPELSIGSCRVSNLYASGVGVGAPQAPLLARPARPRACSPPSGGWGSVLGLIRILYGGEDCVTDGRLEMR